MRMTEIEKRVGMSLKELQSLASRLIEMKANTDAARSEASEAGIEVDGDGDDSDPD